MKCFHNHNGKLNANYLSVFVVLDVFFLEIEQGCKHHQDIIFLFCHKKINNI